MSGHGSSHTTFQKKTLLYPSALPQSSLFRVGVVSALAKTPSHGFGWFPVIFTKVVKNRNRSGFFFFGFFFFGYPLPASPRCAIMDFVNL